MSGMENRTLGGKIYAGWTSLACGFLGVVSPVAALNYAAGRDAFLSYKSATRKGANAKWRPSKDSADNLIRKDRDLTVSRCRDLVRNSEHVAGALQRVCDNVIYKGILPQAACRKVSGDLDQKKNSKLEKIYKKWAKKVKLSELQALVLRHLWSDGEILVHTFPDPTLLESGVVPLGIELLETDQLDRLIHGELSGGNFARHGIEYNSYGHAVAYHILPVHPGDGNFTRYSGNSTRIPAGQILHIFKRERASQTRGMPWLSVIAMTMHDFEEYQNSERIAARLMSSFAYFVQRQTPGATGGQIPGMGQGGQAGISGALPKYLTQPGQILDVPYGVEVKAQQYDRPGDTYESYSKGTLKGASVGANVSYETLSNDYKEASYSSARDGKLTERRGYEVLQKFVNDRFDDPVFDKFITFLRLSGLFPGVLPTEVEVSWLNPGWTWIDPLKDSKASEIEVDSLGITTRRELCAKQGKDYDEVVTQREREQQDLIAKGLLEDKSVEKNAA